ncbi:MAG: hypothetical protein AB8G16_06725 [Gammaproteobacteria bacterium]
MNASITRRLLKPDALLTVSLLPFVWRGVQYATIESAAPAIFILCVALLLSTFRLGGPRLWRFGVRLWAVIVCTYGTLRMLLAGVSLFIPVNSIHAQQISSPVYIATSALYVWLGVALFRSCRNAPRDDTPPPQ